MTRLSLLTATLAEDLACGRVASCEDFLMRVFTYSSEDPSLPAHEAAIARIKFEVRNPKTNLVCEDWHPVIIHAETEPKAREKAETWWAAQIAAEKTKLENRAKQVELMRQRRRKL